MPKKPRDKVIIAAVREVLRDINRERRLRYMTEEDKNRHSLDNDQAINTIRVLLGDTSVPFSHAREYLKLGSQQTKQTKTVKIAVESPAP